MQDYAFKISYQWILSGLRKLGLLVLCGMSFTVTASIIDQEVAEIAKDLRCLVCQNHSVMESDTQVARNIRVYIKKALLRGESRGVIMEKLVDSYGEFVLLTPTKTSKNSILWGVPYILIASLIIWSISTNYKRKPA